MDRSAGISVAAEQAVRGGASIIGAERNISHGPGPEVIDADTVLGDPVVNGAGDDLGEIKAIMLDVSSGRTAYPVLSSGGFLNMSSKLFAIPWSALILDAGERQLVLNIDRKQLKGASGFAKDGWPSMADANWVAELRAYCNIRPYWEDELPALGEPLTTVGTSMSTCGMH